MIKRLKNKKRMLAFYQGELAEFGMGRHDSGTCNSVRAARVSQIREQMMILELEIDELEVSSG